MGKGRGKIRLRPGRSYEVEYWIDGCGVDYLEVPASHAGTPAGVLTFAALQMACRPDLVNVHQLSIKLGPRSVPDVEPMKEKSSNGVYGAFLNAKRRLTRRRKRTRK